MELETYTLQELIDNDFYRLVLDIESITNVLEYAQPRSDQFYIGTNVFKWLDRFKTMTMNDLTERWECSENGVYSKKFTLETDGNSYNWGGNANADINFMLLHDEESNGYALVNIHIAGDIRSNYAAGILLDLDTYSSDLLYNLLDHVFEARSDYGFITIDNKDYSFSGDIFDEYITIYNHSTNKDIEILDIFYYGSEHELNDALTATIKEYYSELN